MKRMQDKVVLITGGGSGVGRADALLMAREGAKVVVTDLEDCAGQAVVAEIAALGGHAPLFLHQDIAEEADWQAVMAAVLARHGRLDGLVNNAAILQMASIEHTTLAMWRQVQRVNSDGYFLGCKYAIEAMKAGGGGAIVNMSSLAALAGLGAFCAYSASKGAVSALTRSVAMHCKSQGLNIRCNSVHPDGIKTPMLGQALSDAGITDLRATAESMARLCEPEDVAQAVLFLASDESRFINGIELRVDNGFMIDGM